MGPAAADAQTMSSRPSMDLVRSAADAQQPRGWQVTEVFRRSRLFLGSYSLLFVLLALRFRQPELEAVCGGIAALGFLDMAWIVFGVSRRTGADPLRLATVDDAGPEVAGYVATYLLPFLTVAEPDGRDIAAYAIFLAVTGLIYVRSDMAQINPTLYLLGRRVLKVVTDQDWDGYVIARSSLKPGAVLHAVPLNDSIRVEVARDE